MALEPLLTSNSYKCSFVQKKKESHHSDFCCRFSELNDSAVVLDADMLNYMKMMNGRAETRMLSTSLCCNVAVHKQFPPKL